MSPGQATSVPDPFPPPWSGGWGVDKRGAYSEVVIGGTALEIRWIPAGSFRMGSPSNEVGRSPSELEHEVELTRGFWLGRYAVTQKEWRMVMGNDPSYHRGDDLPVEQVSWENAVSFCRRLTAMAREAGALEAEIEFRLPTEAEWEYACRAMEGRGKAFNDGSDYPLPGGKYPSLDRLGWYTENSGDETHPVGCKEPNDWGLYDMHGNVWEWCLDCCDWVDGKGVVTDTYVERIRDPWCASGAGRILRGGGYWSRARRCRSASRGASGLGNLSRYFGFRLAAGLAVAGSGASGPEAGGADAPVPEAPAHGTERGA